MSDNKWPEYQFHVLESIKRLESNQAELYQFLREHMNEESDNMRKIMERLQYLENDHKWHTKMWSAAAAIAATIFSTALSYLK